MSLLALKNIGKIYVSEGNVSVGIRGVNLSFNRGEFVAITGKSGSGKSTLLSVISGMDTYEEGELLIEGHSTAHYTQPDWETYRQKYISFIFQDYNIIESFTVLQNVELALMHIRDPRERRKRALELIRRVGLSSHLRQKGSKLSGGQKQRTVIARALAKDSPIILADEPTGNLDSATGKEIIELLREVSRDKLVIVVTHNFEQVEYCATRHIRIFDGAVESDRTLSAPTTRTQDPIAEHRGADKWRGGALLGRAMFSSRPKLTTFMCLLMAVGMLGLFFATSMFSDMNTLFEKNYMFRHIDGRVVLTRQDGAVMSDEEVAELATRFGAESALHYDKLLDSGSSYLYSRVTGTSARVLYTYGEEVSGTVYGRYPEAENEVLLYLPIHLKPAYGTDPLADNNVFCANGSYLNYNVVGVAYYCDNTQYGKAVFSEKGYRTLLGDETLFSNGYTYATVIFTDADGNELSINLESVWISNAVKDGEFQISKDKIGAKGGTIKSITLNTYYYDYKYWDGEYARENELSWTLDLSKMSSNSSEISDAYLVLSASLATELVETYLSSAYRQASLFFANDRAAKAAAEQLNAAGYIAVPSYTTYSPDASETILNTIQAFFTLCAWLLVVIFLAFFINLCSSRTIGTFRGDLAIMRSMGIPVKVIRVAMYVRMLLTLIPAYLLQIAVSICIYTSPTANGIFPYLHAWQYGMLSLGLLLVTIRVTHKQIRKLFGESVKKALKGGVTE